MKRLLIICLLIAGAATTGCRQNPSADPLAVNPLLGDISFVSTYGYSPDASTDEQLRVSTHLEYAERLLRSRNVSGLPPALRERRARLLALLGDYRRAGIFPTNDAYPDRRVPCFIDAEGRICAVGYLIEQTAGRPAAEAINRKFQYAPLLAMNDRLVTDWIAQSGLTREEAAMIQPTYGYQPPPDNNYITPAYGAASAVMSGITLSMSAINGVQASRQSGGKWAPTIGLATGIGQVILGATSFPEDQPDWHGYRYTNESQKMLSMLNIGLGTASIVFSAWNLLSDRSSKERRTTWNVHSFPVAGNGSGLAVSMTRKF